MFYLQEFNPFIRFLPRKTKFLT